MKRIQEITVEWRDELGRKGWGIIEEEMNEFKEAVHESDPDDIEKELKNIIVAVLHSLASLKSLTMD